MAIMTGALIRVARRSHRALAANRFILAICNGATYGLDVEPKPNNPHDPSNNI